MLEIIENYLSLKEQMNELIKRSGYRNNFIAEKIEMRPDYFALKTKRENWSDEEVTKIVKVIESEDVSNYFETVMIDNCFPGNVISSKEFEKIMKW